jgi:hypothetical protein
MTKKPSNYKEAVSHGAKLGSGSRFAALQKDIAAGGAKDPGAVAAAIGRQKYGPAHFQALGSMARKKKP